MTVNIPLILSAGLIDGINPCAFAVMIFFLSYLYSVSKSRKKLFFSGIAYTIAVYISYLLAGLGIFSILYSIGLSVYFYHIAAILAIIVGLINIRESRLKENKPFLLKIPESRKKVIKEWTHKRSVPAAFVLGFLVSMFELPCTGAVYIAILAMLAKETTRFAAAGYLLIYNLMFVIPLLIIMFFALLGTKIRTLKTWKEEHKKYMKLAMGFFLVLLGLYMLVSNGF